MCSWSPLDVYHGRWLIIFDSDTRSITNFSAKENFGKILKVSHFPLEFSLDEKCAKIKTSHRDSSEFSHSYRVSLVFSRPGSKISNKTLWEYINSLLFLPGENPKGKWLNCKNLPKFFLAETFLCLQCEDFQDFKGTITFSWYSWYFLIFFWPFWIT